MAIDYVNNGDTALSVRNKINSTINEVNNIPTEIQNVMVNKADLVNGKVVRTQIPTMLGSWKLLQSYTTAGAFTWTAPDLFGDGRPYKIGVMIIGGGGSGAGGRDMSSQNPQVVTGGASGYSVSVIIEVISGTEFPIVVGAKGGRVFVGDQVGYNGVNGGTSSFNGTQAKGGDGGKYGSTTSNYSTSALGGQSSAPTNNDVPSSINLYGGITFNNGRPQGVVTNHPLSCFNPFEMRLMLGAGGNANRASGRPGGRRQITNLGGGNGVCLPADVAGEGQPASEFGCGGGAVFSNYSGTPLPSAYSGSGADGAVFIYVMEVSG